MDNPLIDQLADARMQLQAAICSLDEDLIDVEDAIALLDATMVSLGKTAMKMEVGHG